MISGNAIFLLLTLATPGTTAPDPAALVQALRRTAPATTAYTEVRYVDVLAQPLVLHGHLVYGADGALTRKVEAPYVETTAIAGGQVTVERKGKSTRRFALSRAPELGAFLESFGALLAGDAERAQRSYELAAEGDASAWRLHLTPRAAGLKRHLRSIEVDGRDGTARCFIVEEGSGDTSVMLVEALADAPLPAAPTREALTALCRARP